MIPADFEEEVRKVDEKGVDVIVDFGESTDGLGRYPSHRSSFSQSGPTTGTRYERDRKG